MSSNRRAIHALVGGSRNFMTGGTHGHSLWCSEHTKVYGFVTLSESTVGVATSENDKTFSVTEDMSSADAVRRGRRQSTSPHGMTPPRVKGAWTGNRPIR